MQLGVDEAVKLTFLQPVPCQGVLHYIIFHDICLPTLYMKLQFHWMDSSWELRKCLMSACNLTVHSVSQCQSACCSYPELNDFGVHDILWKL